MTKMTEQESFLWENDIHLIDRDEVYDRSVRNATYVNLKAMGITPDQMPVDAGDQTFRDGYIAYLNTQG